MSRALTIPALAAAAVLSACAPTLGPPAPHAAAADPTVFRPDDFAWSTAPGRGTIAGRVAYRQGTTRFACSGSSVVLTPETPWTRHRMMILYRSAERSALPVDEVRARTAQAPAGDPSTYVRRTTCDATDHFSFNGLPDGAWYVITTARPDGASGGTMALMRRVVVRSGRAPNVEL